MIKLFFVLYGVFHCSAKYHDISFKNEARKNILLTRFGFNENGTLFVALRNFTVPDAVISNDENTKADRFGIVGFTITKGSQIAESTRQNPHLCQLNQKDQQLDAIFLIFDFETSALSIIKSGTLKGMDICPTVADCFFEPNNRTVPEPETVGFFDKIIWGKKAPRGEALKDFIPLNHVNGHYSTQFALRFDKENAGLYHFIYHNCFSYRHHGFSDKVAVEYSMFIEEKNLGSHLSAGDIPKPKFYLMISFVSALFSILWINVLCKAEADTVYRIHHLMSALVVLKTMSVFCHGMNFYFVSLYGHQREAWAILFYITHLLKGALLFGTLILIGTGYTFFKSFLTDRDRNLFIVVLPLQVIDNIAMVILNESEVAEQRYVFWFELFTLLDLVCCAAVLFPILWSINHLRHGATTDGKASFNLQRLIIFRRFYVIVISYIYVTRLGAFFLEQDLPFNEKWVAEAVTETVTLVFFFVVGNTFKPVKRNPYLKLSQQDEGDEEDGMA
uniref:Lung seven transmembrane receptor family protein n=1 Tax=Bursaphelenchus xylophilus TaxID=6326 RepID=A0A1I7SMU4_BURXY